MTTSVEITWEYEMKSETVQDYKDWIDQVFSQQFVPSHLKGQLMGSVEYQDWSDSDSEDDFGDCSSLQQLFSEECQTEESNVFPPVVLVHESQQVNQSLTIDHRPQEDPQFPKTVLDHEPLEDSQPPTLSVDHEPHGDTEPPTVVLVHEPKEDLLPPTVDPSELQHAYTSLEMKDPIKIKGDSLKSCENYLDYMHVRLCGTDTLGVASISSTWELEEWIDQRMDRESREAMCNLSIERTQREENWASGKENWELDAENWEPGVENWAPDEETWELESYSISDFGQKCLEEKIKLCIRISPQADGITSHTLKDSQVSKNQNGKLELDSVVGTFHGNQCQEPRESKGEKSSEESGGDYDGCMLNTSASDDQPIYGDARPSTWEDITNRCRCLSPILKASATCLTQDNPDGQLAP